MAFQCAVRFSIIASFSNIVLAIAKLRDVVLSFESNISLVVVKRIT